MPRRHLHSVPEAFDHEHASQQLTGVPNVHVMGRRVAATLLDFLPLGLLTWMVDATFGVAQNVSVLSPPAGIPYTSNSAVAFPWLYLVLVTYYAVQEALFGTTFGKALMGLQVVQDDGNPLTLGSALLRNLVRPIDAASGYLLGWILALCSSRRRRLGDHLAGTLVVSADSLPALSRRLSRPWVRLSVLAILCASFIACCLSFDYYGRPPLVIQGLANGSGPVPATLFTDRGTITDLTLSQPSWQANTVTYAMTFHAFQHGIESNCQGHITLIWLGFLDGWGDYQGDTTCHPLTSP
jgi:uncharacterized RDD family membrane protein YckC